MHNKVAFYAQSGGVTAVINASAAGVIETARRHEIKVLAGRNGILGALREELIDTTQESSADIAGLCSTPGAAFGSCRHKLPSPALNHAEYERLFAVFAAHKIGYFFYNGGGDSQDTTHKISQMGQALDYPIQCIGIPKTIDNDLPFTDNCPGFGSTAKYLATSIREIDYDLKSMAASSTKVFILEVMGRHTGWVAAAAGLAQETPEDGPHLILVPEVPFKADHFLAHVAESVKKQGRCVIVASEGIQDSQGALLAKSGLRDVFGHLQLGGVAPMLAHLVQNRLGYRCHWAVADYLQRSARHIASQTDLNQAYCLGEAAVNLAIAGHSDLMVGIKRLSNQPYTWEVDQITLSHVANQEKILPQNFINADGLHITKSAREYLLPLIQGEAPTLFKNGLPHFTKLQNRLVPKKLAPWQSNLT